MTMKKIIEVALVIAGALFILDNLKVHIVW